MTAERLEELKRLTRTLDGNLKAELHGLKVNGQVIVDEMQYLIRHLEKKQKALQEAKKLQPLLTPGSKEEKQLQKIIDLLQS